MSVLHSVQAKVTLLSSQGLCRPFKRIEHLHTYASTYLQWFSYFSEALLTTMQLLNAYLSIQSKRWQLNMSAEGVWEVRSHLSRVNSHRGSSGRSYSGIGSSCAELRRIVIRTRGVLEFIDELDSADTYRTEENGWSSQSGVIRQIKFWGITRGVNVSMQVGLEHVLYISKV